MEKDDIDIMLVVSYIRNSGDRYTQGSKIHYFHQKSDYVT